MHIRRNNLFLSVGSNGLFQWTKDSSLALLFHDRMTARAICDMVRKIDDHPEDVSVSSESIPLERAKFHVGQVLRCIDYPSYFEVEKVLRNCAGGWSYLNDKVHVCYEEEYLRALAESEYK